MLFYICNVILIRLCLVIYFGQTSTFFFVLRLSVINFAVGSAQALPFLIFIGDLPFTACDTSLYSFDKRVSG